MNDCDPFTEGEWTNDFIKEVKGKSLILNQWVQRSELFKSYVYKPTPYNVKNFPFGQVNYQIESHYLNLIVQRVSTFHGVQVDRCRFCPAHAWECIVEIVCNVMNVLWYNDSIKAARDKVGYLDWTVRQSIQRPPGFGIGYLCLKIAKRITLNHKLQTQIDLSRDLSPRLPFNSNDLKLLVDITGSESRLRLALVLVHELGRIQDQIHIDLHVQNFPESFWYLIHKNGFNELEIFQECIIVSEVDSPCSELSSSLPVSHSSVYLSDSESKEDSSKQTHQISTPDSRGRSSVGSLSGIFLALDLCSINPDHLTSENQSAEMEILLANMYEDLFG